MKILLIIHTNNLIYGASKSISLFTKNTEDDIDLILPKSISQTQSDDEIISFYGCKVKNIFRFWLPHEFIYSGMKKPNMTEKNFYKYHARELLSKVDYFKINKLIRKNKYDCIYLNSITLYPLSKLNSKVVMHVREVLDIKKKRRKKIEKILSKAKGLIFIDFVSKNSIDTHEIKSTVINNPFDMSNVFKMNVDDIYLKFNINNEAIVFSIIGTITEGKGVDFVIKTFLEYDDDNSVLLVIGSGDSKYYNSCREISEKDQRIIFIDESCNIEEIYAISDCIIRGENFFVIGRTIYEGLYSGTSVLIPGTKNEKNLIFDADLFEDKIYFYTPRKEKELIDSFRKISKKKSNQIIPKKENISEMIYQHKEFLLKCLEENEEMSERNE